MKPKRGRPKVVGATKEKIISTRVESSTAAALQAIGARFGLPQAQLIRQAISEYVQRNIGAQRLTLTAQATAITPSEDLITKEAAFNKETDDQK